jgi:tetratricopeptide (TPR) repeat protein
LAAFRDLQDGRNEAIALGNLARSIQDAGRLSEALAEYDRAIETYRRVGAPEHEYLAYRGSVLHEEGRFSDAVDHYERALAGLSRQTDRRRGIVLGLLGAALSALGKQDAAAKALEEAERIVAAVGPSTGPALLLAHRGRLEAPPLAGTSLDLRLAVRLLERARGDEPSADRPAQPAARDALEVGPEARWFSVSGDASVDLSRRRSLRLMLLALASSRSRGKPALSLDELFAAGWPDERIGRDAAIRRVYTGIGMLRDLGLREVLKRRDDGYLLDPEVRLVFTTPAADR